MDTINIVSFLVTALSLLFALFAYFENRKTKRDLIVTQENLNATQINLNSAQENLNETQRNLQETKDEIIAINARFVEIAILTTASLNDIAKSLKKIDDPDISFEIERDVRRISLFTTDDELIKTSLFWFIENGNLQDVTHLERVIKNKCITKTNLIALVNEAIKSIIKKYPT